MSSWLAREPLLLLGLAAGTLACGPPAHQLQRKRRWLQDYKVRQRHIPFLPPQQQTLLCPGGSRAPLPGCPVQGCTTTLSQHPVDHAVVQDGSLCAEPMEPNRRSGPQLCPTPLISCLGLYVLGLPHPCPACEHMPTQTAPSFLRRAGVGQTGRRMGGWTDVPSRAELPQGCPACGAEVLPSLEPWLPDGRTGTPF